MTLRLDGSMKIKCCLNTALADFILLEENRCGGAETAAPCKSMVVRRAVIDTD